MDELVEELEVDDQRDKGQRSKNQDRLDPSFAAANPCFVTSPSWTESISFTDMVRIFWRNLALT